MSRWGIGLSEKMKACKEAEPFTDILEGDGGVPEKDPPSSSKAGVWCSYILALLGREQIAEALSQVALKEIIGVVLIYGLKALFENLSKNNSWPDKGNSTPPEDGAG